MTTTVAAAEKSEEQLRKEINELHRQQREITERLRDPRGIRRGGLAGGRQRGFIRPADRNEGEDQPPAKRRLSSAVVKIEEGEIEEEAGSRKDLAIETIQNENRNETEKKVFNRGGNRRPSRMVWSCYIGLCVN